MSETVRLVARRRGTGNLLNLSLPAAISHAIPPGDHTFEASFIDDGIKLKYVGVADPPRRVQPFDTPGWAT